MKLHCKVQCVAVVRHHRHYILYTTKLLHAHTTCSIVFNYVSPSLSLFCIILLNCLPLHTRSIDDKKRRFRSIVCLLYLYMNGWIVLITIISNCGIVELCTSAKCRPAFLHTQKIQTYKTVYIYGASHMNVMELKLHL